MMIHFSVIKWQSWRTVITLKGKKETQSLLLKGRKKLWGRIYKN